MNRTHDLNQAMNEDDEDLLRNVDSAEVDAPSDTAEGDDFGTINDREMMTLRMRINGFGKQKKKTGASPFASLEDYEHLLNEDGPTKNKGKGKDRTSLSHERTP